MTVSITYSITQTPTASNSFTAVFEVLDATNIQREIFVHDSGTLEFTGVATVYDMRTWPAARDSDFMSYRASTLVRSYDTLDEALTFVAYTRGRIETLRIEWQLYNDAFVASLIVTTPES